MEAGDALVSDLIRTKEALSHTGKQNLFKSSKIFTKTNVTLKNDNISIITFKILCVKYLPLFISYSAYCALFKNVCTMCTCTS